MIAFKVTINDNDPIIIGQDDWTVLTSSITASSLPDNQIDLHCHFGGLSKEKEHGFGEHFRWSFPEIKLNDQILVEPIETDTVQPPTKRFRSDKKKKENPFTEEEQKELRYQSYLEYKKEFEPE